MDQHKIRRFLIPKLNYFENKSFVAERFIQFALQK
jgi:hypothetical protein